MAKRKWTEHYFSKRLKAEREDRKWTQAELAKLLDDRDVPMHWTTIAKIEKGERSVRIDEAAAIAEVFGVSVDALLGRTVGVESDLAYMLRALLDTARQSSAQLMAIGGALQSRFRDLESFEFDGRETVYEEGGRAGDALEKASSALLRLSAVEVPEAGLKVAEELIDQAATEKLLKLLKERGWDETQS
jgi:transcriptional regulator with XRE-family HTH domain